MEKKYELTDETIKLYGRTLHRIKALKDFNNVKKGDLGGFIEKEDNLSHEGKCWIYDNAHVCDNAYVYGNAHVYDKARVYGDARVYDNAHVCDNVYVCGDASVYDNAYVCGDASVCGNAHIFGNVTIIDRMHLSCNAYVKSLNDICYISCFGSRNRSTTFFRCKDDTIKVKCGCFLGTLDEFCNKVKETHGNNVYAKEYLGIIDVVKIKLYR